MNNRESRGTIITLAVCAGVTLFYLWAVKQTPATTWAAFVRMFQ